MLVQADDTIHWAETHTPLIKTEAIKAAGVEVNADKTRHVFVLGKQDNLGCESV
jgi:hypothetical protein